jgi:hypothetical protein
VTHALAPLNRHGERRTNFGTVQLLANRCGRLLNLYGAALGVSGRCAASG